MEEDTYGGEGGRDDISFLFPFFYSGKSLLYGKSERAKLLLFRAPGEGKLEFAFCPPAAGRRPSGDAENRARLSKRKKQRREGNISSAIVCSSSSSGIAEAFCFCCFTTFSVPPSFPAEFCQLILNSRAPSPTHPPYLRRARYRYPSLPLLHTCLPPISSPLFPLVHSLTLILYFQFPAAATPFRKSY